MEPRRAHIVLVEDDPGQARLAQRTLERAGHAVTWVSNAATSLEGVRQSSAEMVLLDRGLPDGDGLDVLAALRAEWPELCVIMLTGADDVTVAVKAMRTGAWDYLLKRADLSHLDDLTLVVERNLQRIQLRREREALNAAVRASEGRYRELFDNASDLIVVCDDEGVIQRANRAFRDLTGLGSEEGPGSHLGHLVAPSGRSNAETICSRVAEGQGEAVTFELHIKKANGDVAKVEFRARAIADQGRSNGFQAIGRDVTEKRRVEEMKADFLAMVTHDMKNPVSVIAGYTEILLDDVCARGPCRDMLVSIDASARGLLHLILNFLDLSRIEAGVLHLQRVPISLNEVMRGVIRYELPLARVKNIQIDEDLGSVPPVSADRLQIDRVFLNLVGNAIKFTPHDGHIAISTRAVNGCVVVKVSDTGPGIPEDQIPHLFNKYRRLAQSAETQGTGLGLFIAKSMVDAHGGTVRAECGAGGATFVVELPVSGRE